MPVDPLTVWRLRLLLQRYHSTLRAFYLSYVHCFTIPINIFTVGLRLVAKANTQDDCAILPAHVHTDMGLGRM
jgi:hypothetical protein